MGKTIRHSIRVLALLTVFLWLIHGAVGRQQVSPGVDPAEKYTKSEHLIRMRDGIRLYTAVYQPRDRTRSYPILMQRTPYGSGPYGPAYRRGLGPSPAFQDEGYIFVYQDVRGTFKSEGEFEDVRPHIRVKKSSREIDESSDTWDTIEWLVRNIPGNNGRVGVWGISYPGFYTVTAMMDPHPALGAVSPQAPIADWFLGDDDHHNGAFFLFDSFTFNMFFGMPRPGPTENQFRDFELGTPDAYQFFLDLGPIENAQKNYFKGRNKYWNDVTTHWTYDEFWQSRSVLEHLGKPGPAALIVGGWFDAEDLFGPLNIYRAVEKLNRANKAFLVMGPWSHGGWSRGAGDSLGDIRFDVRTAEDFRDKVELPFFRRYLKDEGDFPNPEALVFRTGANEWASYANWPPANLRQRNLYLRENGKLSFEAPGVERDAFDEYTGDPAKPVPYTASISDSRGTGYMIEDQRFSTRRTDVATYRSEPLREPLTLAGPIRADLFVSTTGTDADFIVRLIDVFPDDAPNNSPRGQAVPMGGYQMLVRAEVMRGKFRNSFSKPEPFVPNRPAEVAFTLQDVSHTFKPGHRIMVAIQSSWFPLVDRNPQTFVNIFKASEGDFRKADHRIHRSARLASHLRLGILEK